MKTPEQGAPILIAGAGIGGVAFALALARKQIPVVILERTEIFSDIGAGIQLGPNAMRILLGWECKEALEQVTASPDGIDIVKGTNNRIINHIRLLSDAEELFGHPYRTIHRADIHKLLRDQLRHYETASIINGFAVRDFSQSPEGIVTVESEDGRKITGQALIGADGVWSRVRSHLAPELSPQYAGKTAWRILIPIEQAPAAFAKNHVRLYMGPKSHLVHYPVRSGKMLNIVAIISDKTEPGNLWDNSGEVDQLITEMPGWSQDIKDFLSSIPQWNKWPLYDMPAPKNWTNGNVTLLGDAAHPALPFMAQGGVMAIEDAECLANCLSEQGNTIKSALETYNSQRLQRVRKVQNLSRRLGSIYHLTGPVAFARNMVIANRTSRSLLSDYNWLYGWKPEYA